MVRERFIAGQTRGHDGYLYFCTFGIYALDLIQSSTLPYNIYIAANRLTAEAVGAMHLELIPHAYLPPWLNRCVWHGLHYVRPRMFNRPSIGTLTQASAWWGIQPKPRRWFNISLTASTYLS